MDIQKLLIPLFNPSLAKFFPKKPDSIPENDYQRIDIRQLCTQCNSNETNNIDHNQMRVRIPLLGPDEETLWKKKLIVAKRIYNLVKAQKDRQDDLLKKYSSLDNKTVQKNINQLKKVESPSPENLQELEDLKFVLGLRIRKSDVYDKRAFTAYMDYDKFKCIVKLAVEESQESDLCQYLTDKETLALVTCISVKSSRFPEKTQDAFLNALPERFLGVKDSDHYLHLAILARYIFTELCEFKTARDVETFEKWDKGVFNFGFNKIRNCTNPIDFVSAAFPKLVEGTNPCIRPWELSFARWSKPNYAQDLVAAASAWFLLHHLKVVKDDGSFDVEKMRGISQWLPELKKSGLDSMYIVSRYVQDILSIFRLGARRLFELGIVNQHNLVGIAQDQFRPWDYTRNKLRGNHQNELGRLEIAIKLYDAGLGRIKINDGIVTWSFSGANLNAWNQKICPRIGYKSFDDFLRRVTSWRYTEKGHSLKELLSFLFDEKNTNPGRQNNFNTLANYENRTFELEFDTNTFPEFNKLEDTDDLDSWSKKISSGACLAAIIYQEIALQEKSFEELLQLKKHLVNNIYNEENNFNSSSPQNGNKNQLMNLRFKLQACERLIALGNSYEPIRSQATVKELDQYLRQIAMFNKLPYGRISLLRAIPLLVKTNEKPHGLLDTIPSGLIDNGQFVDPNDYVHCFRYWCHLKNQSGNVSLKTYEDVLNSVGFEESSSTVQEK